MVSLIKAAKHLKKVGVKAFVKEFKQGQEEVAQDPLVALRLQSQGYTGVILFSIVSAIVLFWREMWYIAGVFIFNCLIMGGQLLSTRNQIKMFKGLQTEEAKLIEDAELEL